jgi:hypothetical protein
MNYRKIYNQIIDKARDRNIDGYFEIHHIIPSSVGGRNTEENKVKLTAREHFICHWILHVLFPENDKLFMAFHMMCLVGSQNQKRYTPSSRIIEYAKIEKSNRMKGKPGYWKDKKRPEISGENHPTFKDQSLKKRISKKLMNHPVSEETRERISNSNKGKSPWNEGKKTGSLSDEHKLKISKSNLGKSNGKMKEETKEKLRNIQLNKSSSAKKIIQKDGNGEVIQFFNSIKEAKEKTGFTRIIDGLKGRRKFINGFIWEYYGI